MSRRKRGGRKAIRGRERLREVKQKMESGEEIDRPRSRSGEGKEVRETRKREAEVKGEQEKGGETKRGQDKS